MSTCSAVPRRPDLRSPRWKKIYLIYQSVTGHNDRVEVDLNFLFRLPVAGTTVQEMWQPGELERLTVRVVSLQEILIRSCFFRTPQKKPSAWPAIPRSYGNWSMLAPIWRSAKRNRRFDHRECSSDQINLLKINEINIRRGVV